MIAEAPQLLWALRRVRVWIEWIDSESNPSDGLSRDGVLCNWCASKGIVPTIAEATPWASVGELVDHLLHTLPVAVRTLG